MSGRLILGNLDAEGELARMRAAADRPRAPWPPLSPAATRRAAEAATLLRVFAEDGDRLWTAAAVDPARLPPAPGLVIPELVTGDPEPANHLLAWAQTPRSARLRSPVAAGPPPALWNAGSPLRLSQAVWELPPAAPAVVGRVHHRRFHLATATALGLALPGAAMVGSLPELAALLAGSPRWSGAAVGGGRWLAKAPLSAAGRERLSGAGAADLARPAVRSRLDALLAVHGELLVEPRLERTADFGCAALLTPDGLRIAGVHRQIVDSRGGFRGIRVGMGARGAAEDAAGAGDGALAPAERAALERAVEGVAEALAREGYSGPFGVDAWRYRDAGGGEAFHPLGEINARTTFGLVAHALAERLAGEGGGEEPPPREVELRFGGQPPAAGEGATTLLAPGDGSRFGVWWVPAP